MDWTPEEIQFIRDNWGKMSPEEIGQALSRHVAEVNFKACGMGFTLLTSGVHYKKALPPECWPKVEKLLWLLNKAATAGIKQINLKTLKSALS